MRLNDRHLRDLEVAANHPQGLVTNPYVNGLDKFTWDCRMKKLATAGIVAPYVHGGYEITQAGREAYAQAKEAA